MNYLLNHTSADELKSSLQCARENGRPFPIERLQQSLENERQSVGARSTIIRMLEREIRRQEKGL